MLPARRYLLTLSLLLGLAGCYGAARQADPPPRPSTATPRPGQRTEVPEGGARNPGRLIHVVVALCDNKYQGIVPVPERIGNGDDPANNLYWGAAYGVKTFFRKSADWAVVADITNPKAGVLERSVFKHRERNAYLVADAYRGREIRQSTVDFLSFASGRGVETVEVGAGVKRTTLYVGGAADLVAYVGHDGLMDFTLPEYPERADERRREAIILACASQAYFEQPLRRTGAEPLLWTTGLMAPEAYVLKAALDGWLLNEDGDKVRRRAAAAYDRYQKSGLRGALRLFASGW